MTSLGDGSRVQKTDPRVEAYGAVDELAATLGLALAAVAPDPSVSPEPSRASPQQDAAPRVAPGAEGPRGGAPDPLAGILHRVRNELLDVGADLCLPEAPPGAKKAAGGDEAEGKKRAAGAPGAPGAPEGPDPEKAGRDRAAASGRGPLRVSPEQVSRLERDIDRLNKGLEPLRSFVLPGGQPFAAWLHLCRTVCRRAERRVVALAAAASINDQVLLYLNRLSDLLFVMARRANDGGKADVLWEPGRSLGEGGKGGGEPGA